MRFDAANSSQSLEFDSCDKGFRHGVEKTDGVICPEGIVGQIVSVSENFSIAMSVLNSKTNNIYLIDLDFISSPNSK